LIEGWEYFVVFGSSLAGISVGLNWFITYDTPYKTQLDEIGADIKVLYLEQLIRHIMQRESENPQGITDKEINAELHKIFIISKKLKICEYLNNKNTDYTKHILLLLILAGISIAGYPFILTLPEIIMFPYGSLLISFPYLTGIVLFIKYSNKKELKRKFGDLEYYIYWDAGLPRRRNESA